MTALHGLSQLIVLFVALAGFLFGQLFNGVFSVAGTLAGIGGVLAAALAPFRARTPFRRVVIAGCALGLAGAALDVYDYYSTAQVRVVSDLAFRSRSCRDRISRDARAGGMRSVDDGLAARAAWRGSAPCNGGRRVVRRHLGFGVEPSCTDADTR